MFQQQRLGWGFVWMKFPKERYTPSRGTVRGDASHWRADKVALMLCVEARAVDIRTESARKHLRRTSEPSRPNRALFRSQHPRIRTDKLGTTNLALRRQAPTDSILQFTTPLLQVLDSTLLITDPGRINVHCSPVPLPYTTHGHPATVLARRPASPLRLRPVRAHLHHLRPPRPPHPRAHRRAQPQVPVPRLRDAVLQAGQPPAAVSTPHISLRSVHPDARRAIPGRLPLSLGSRRGNPWEVFPPPCPASSCCTASRARSVSDSDVARARALACAGRDPRSDVG